jgi:hypothetical protein
VRCERVCDPFLDPRVVVDFREAPVREREDEPRWLCAALPRPRAALVFLAVFFFVVFFLGRFFALRAFFALVLLRAAGLLGLLERPLVVLELLRALVVLRPLLLVLRPLLIVPDERPLEVRLLVERLADEDLLRG